MDSFDRPVPLQCHLKDPPICPGDGRLQKLAVRLLGRLTDHERVALKLWLPRCLPEMRLTTSCSGTDSPKLVWKSLAAAVDSELGVKLCVRSLWACEKSKVKQRFLNAVWPDLPTVHNRVEDLEQLEGDFGNAHYSGFPCTSASMLNPHANTKLNLNCVRDGAEETGSVFQALMRALRTRGAPLSMLILENVASLARGTNLDEVLQCLSKAGFSTKVWHLNPRDWGSVQN